MNNPVKDDTSFPFSLQFGHQGVKYALIGLIAHSGTFTNGHYIAACKYPDGKWYEFNDLKTEQKTPKYILGFSGTQKGFTVSALCYIKEKCMINFNCFSQPFSESEVKNEPLPPAEISREGLKIVDTELHRIENQSQQTFKENAALKAELEKLLLQNEELKECIRRTQLHSIGSPGLRDAVYLENMIHLTPSYPEESQQSPKYFEEEDVFETNQSLPFKKEEEDVFETNQTLFKNQKEILEGDLSLTTVVQERTQFFSSTFDIEKTVSRYARSFPAINACLARINLSLNTVEEDVFETSQSLTVDEESTDKCESIDGMSQQRTPDLFLSSPPDEKNVAQLTPYDESVPFSMGSDLIEKRLIWTGEEREPNSIPKKVIVQDLGELSENDDSFNITECAVTSGPEWYH